MPVHDWSRVDAGVFHAFQMGWNWQLQEALNTGRLPPNFYSLVEQQTVRDDEDASRRVADLLTLHAGPAVDRLPPRPAVQGGLALAEAPPKVRHRATLEPVLVRAKNELRNKSLTMRVPNDPDRAAHSKQPLGLAPKR